MKHYKLNFDWGPLWISVENNELIELSFQSLEPWEMLDKNSAFYKELKLYFQGKLKKFTFNIHPKGTAFQIAVWNELLNIPYGQTVSYSDIASAINSPKAVRAVGTAIGKNPIAIVIPCHRVINKNGGLGGYSGGLEFKKMLMEVENIG